MGEKLVLHLPLPPTLNQTYAAYPVGKRGERLKCRIVQHERAKDYKKMVAELTLIQWKMQEPFPIDKDTRFMVELFTFLDKNSRDVDSNIKLVMDGVMKGLKDATDLKGLSDLRVFDAPLRKIIVGEEQTFPFEQGLYVVISEWKGYDLDRLAELALESLNCVIY